MNKPQTVFREAKLCQLISHANGCEKLLVEDPCEAAEKMLAEAIKACCKFVLANPRIDDLKLKLKVQLLKSKHAALLSKQG